jgi:dTDP-4-amino-4,6-dideoxygalactose transaminase
MATIPLVDLKAQYYTIKDEIDAAMARIVANTSFVGGQELKQFEDAFADYQGVQHAVGVASGTAALVLALHALDVGPGDEVITSAHTFFATVEAIELVGATPILVDIDPVTFNIDPALIEAKITPATRALLPVHLYGRIAPMDAIMAIAARHHLLVIEDAAQAHGATYAGQRAGAWGHAACFSFYPGKNLGAYGDGGAVLTNDEAVAVRVKRLRDHGSPAKYHHAEVGYCERLDAMQAAILAVKLPHLDGWNAARRRHAAYYTDALQVVPGLTVPALPRNGDHVFHIYAVRVDGDRDRVKQALNDAGIGAGIHYPIPVHLQPALAHHGWQQGDFPHTEAAAASIISLPLFAELTSDQMDQVATALKRAVATPVG